MAKLPKLSKKQIKRLKSDREFKRKMKRCEICNKKTMMRSDYNGKMVCSKCDKSGKSTAWGNNKE